MNLWNKPVRISRAILFGQDRGTVGKGKKRKGKVIVRMKIRPKKEGRTNLSQEIAPEAEELQGQ